MQILRPFCQILCVHAEPPVQSKLGIMCTNLHPHLNSAVLIPPYVGQALTCLGEQGDWLMKWYSLGHLGGSWPGM